MTRRVRFLALGLIFLATPVAASERLACHRDATTGFPLPPSSPGLCVVTFDDVMKLVQRTDNGLLILSPISTLADSAITHADGSLSFHLYDHDTDVTYCPPTLLDPLTGAPTSLCVSDVGTLAAGPEALTGSARAYGSLMLDADLGAGCPSGLYVAGSVRSLAGELLQVEGAVALNPRSLPQREPTKDARWCEVVHHRLDIALVRDAEAASVGAQRKEDGLRRLLELNERDVALVEALTRLDDMDFDFLRRMLAFSPEQLDRLDFFLQRDGAALLDADGKISEFLGDPTGATVLRASGLRDLVERTLSRINNIVIPRINSIQARIPDRGDIRGLLGELPDVGPIADALRQIKQTFGGVLAIVEDLRDGFETWESPGCGSTSPCGKFKADMTTLFSDIRDASEFVQTLACLRRPGLEIRQLNTSLIEELINDRAPHVVLYGLSKTLNRVAPEWRTLVSGILGEIPEETRAAFVELCTGEEEGTSQPAARGSVASAQPLCKVLRPREVGLALVAARAVAKKNEEVAKFLDKFIKDDLNEVIGAVAAGGATVNIHIKNPPKITTEMIQDVLSKLEEDSIKDILDKRDQCLEADDNIESDLLECLPRSTYFIQDLPNRLEPFPRFKDVLELVELRRNQIEDCQTRDACQDLDVATASQYLEQAREREGTPGGYEDLCCAYDALIGRAACESISSSARRLRAGPYPRR